MPNDIARCAWANDALLIQYHDTVYGRPRKSDAALFAKLCLEGFEAGLSWRTVLAKQPAFERAFCGFSFCGPVICESFLMSVGAIEAHEPGCALFGTHHAPLP